MDLLDPWDVDKAVLENDDIQLLSVLAALELQIPRDRRRQLKFDGADHVHQDYYFLGQPESLGNIAPETVEAELNHIHGIVLQVASEEIAAGDPHHLAKTLQWYRHQAEMEAQLNMTRPEDLLYICRRLDREGKHEEADQLWNSYYGRA